MCGIVFADRRYSETQVLKDGDKIIGALYKRVYERLYAYS